VVTDHCSTSPPSNTTTLINDINSGHAEYLFVGPNCLIHACYSTYYTDYYGTTLI